MNLKKILGCTAALTLAAGIISANNIDMPASANNGTGKTLVEYLDRGIYAVKSGNGMFVSWRFNADDDDNAEFRLYRDNTLVYTSKAGSGATSYQDNGGNPNSKYRVDTVVNGTVVSYDDCHFNSGSNYFDIPLNSPGAQYSPNDCCVGDVDGDGQYEIFLKWDPNNSQDNSKSGYTDNVYIDCVTLEGKTLWRVDLGKNIRAGQHYTQMCVADFDGDGKAELITKTADGTKDGAGKVIGDGSKDHRNSSGYVLSGPEFMTLFDGETGAALDTINFPVPRGDVNSWGDKYGNRVDRMNSGIAYLDGVHPSAVYGRGYYTRMTLSAIDVADKKLSVRWIFDSGNSYGSPGYGQGNHNIMAGDVDNDGRQEISMGDCVIDDNGKCLWSSGKGHGDAQHLGDLLPDRPGLELWQCHEEKPWGVTLFDASNGKVIFHKDGDKDTGRCCADNIWAGNKGAEFWGARPANTVMDGNGNAIGNKQPSQNFLVYWDGDLERELLDGTMVSKMTGANKIDYIFNCEGCESNNSTKSVPCLTADLFGDWREEIILRTSDNKHLRVWCTTSPTDVRLTTLMHDAQYRAQNCCQQSSYNQPPHPSFFLGTGYPLPARPAVTVLKSGSTALEGTLIKELTINDKNNRYNWSIQNGMDAGTEVFGDRAFKFTDVPEKLRNTEWIRTACDSKKYTDNEARFTAGEDITVYVGLDSRIEQTPDWLSDWTRTDMSLTDDGNPVVTYNVYKKNYSSGSEIVLGKIANSSVVNYVVMTAVKEPTEFIPGDINDDKLVNVFDMVLMRRAVKQAPSDEREFLAADIDGNGVIDVTDALLLQDFLLGRNKELK